MGQVILLHEARKKKEENGKHEPAEMPPYPVEVSFEHIPDPFDFYEEAKGG